MARMIGRARPPYEESPTDRREALEDRQMMKAVAVAATLLVYALALWL